MSRMRRAVVTALVAALVCAALATPLGQGSYWAADSPLDYVTVWLNGLLFAASGLTCFALAHLVGGVLHTPLRAGLLAIAGVCGVLLFFENGLEDTWHQSWLGSAYDVLITGFGLALLSAIVVLLVVPGARWLGIGLVLVVVSPFLAALLPHGNSDRGQSLGLMVGFVALGICIRHAENLRGDHHSRDALTAAPQ